MENFKCWNMAQKLLSSKIKKCDFSGIASSLVLSNVKTSKGVIYDERPDKAECLFNSTPTSAKCLSMNSSPTKELVVIEYSKQGSLLSLQSSISAHLYKSRRMAQKLR